MSYTECKFTLTPFRPFNEILLAHLSELAFESFSEDESQNQLVGYLETTQFDEDAVKEICEQFKQDAQIELEVNQIKKENWNKKWEENFEPIQVGDFCLIRAPFHEAGAAVKYEVIIEPKMSFGTGHHQTTQMMIELMKTISFVHKKVLDMGSGTGILAILAKKMGAEKVDAIDIEEWAYENMTENTDRNQVEVNTFLGDAELLNQKQELYDVIFANINKNILLQDLSIYDVKLEAGGTLNLSGFFVSDVDELMESPVLEQYTLNEKRVKETWCALKLIKQG